MKLFFAIWPDADTREQLHAMQTRLLPLTGGRGTVPATFHLTLCFLGEVASARLDELLAIGGAVKARAFDIRINKVSCFDSAKVGWAGSKLVAPALMNLQAAIQQGVSQAGFNVDPRPFRPHLTLVRHLPQSFETMSTQELQWPVSGFSLVVSRADAAGVRYELLKTWLLGA
ncbi:MAG TPA: RNA 2',3'-cyclic phosphodiesterase [Usitatibacteraceae bacterium]